MTLNNRFESGLRHGVRTSIVPDFVMLDSINPLDGEKGV